MTKHYHMVEKGLALPAPRPGFGVEVTKRLSAQMESALLDGICDHEVLLSADALESYAAFNRRNAATSHHAVAAILENVRNRGVEVTDQAVKFPEPRTVDARSNLSLLTSRASVRTFSGMPVPRDVLLQAAIAAQHAPCVCNRQASHIYFLTEKEDREKALSYQNGNRGFGDTADVIAIITVDIAQMLEPIERYQHWIDGGLFAQNFLLAIHAQGYGACPLNWSAPVMCDIGIRKLGYLPPSESIVMMVAIGALKEAYQVARSERRPLSDVAHFVSQGCAQ
ncbi:nitroreductase family protein [Stenotrophomonas sp. PUT21]|uniref:nitroreductase family protein n=1 Tax=Stenotrophomonas TaxID=40323 RepID=UPI003B78A6FB